MTQAAAVTGLHLRVVDDPYRLLRGGTELLIPRSVPLVPDASIVDRVRVETDADRFTEYGPEDESWRRYFGFVREEVRPAAWVRILDVTCPVTGNRTRAVFCHPDMIDRIRQTDRVVSRPIVFFHGTPI